MRRITTISIVALFFSQFTILAQTANWINGTKRKALYPDSQYFKGFAGEAVSSKKPADDLLDRLSELARTELVQSIQVSIKSESSYELENINAATDERFKQQSVSLSQANIVGLKTETYYDKKKKQAYAFAYANKAEVRDYYQKNLEKLITEVDNKLSIAQQALNRDDKQLGLKSYYDCLPLLTEISRAQTLLLAMGISDDLILNTSRVNSQKRQVRKGISDLLRNQDLTMGELAYFMALGLNIQTTALKQSVNLEVFSFQDTKEKTDFSARFQEIFAKNLIEASGYTIKNERQQNYSIIGTYWDQENSVKVIAVLKDNQTGQALTSVEGILSHNWLIKNNVVYVPELYRKIQLLNHITLKTQTPKVQAKAGLALRKPLEVQAYSEKNGTTEALKNIPIKFYFGDGAEIDIINSDTEGRAKCIIKKIPGEQKIQIIKATLDLPTYLSLGISSPFYQRIAKEHTLPNVRFIIQITGITAYFEVSEKNLGSPLHIKFIEPKIKDALSKRGFEFVDDVTNADYTISIKSNSRSGSEYSGLYFSYVDATISVLDMSVGTEIYKNAYSNIKGGGLSYKQAGIKAYESAAEEITQEVVRELTK